MARRRVIDAVIADSATMSISTIVNGAAGAVAGDPARPMTMRGFTVVDGRTIAGHQRDERGDRSVLLDHSRWRCRRR